MEEIAFGLIIFIIFILGFIVGRISKE